MECESSLTQVDQSGLYALKNREQALARALFMFSGEVDTEFQIQGQSKRIHLLILCPNLDVAKQLTNIASKYGDLSSDGRPKLHVAPPELVEAIMEIDPWNEVIPAHIWTPFFSLFGSRSGFDKIEDCFEDRTCRIHALETGLSSDPAMNWRLSTLDRFALVSNSDSHSPWPYRLGREANVFELPEVSYKQVIDAIRRKDSGKFLMTIETDPCYGKYHYTGHRNCDVWLSPSESRKYSDICPVCKKKLTVGVLDRVVKLADRAEGYRPEGAIPYISLIPLQEVISSALGVKEVFAKSVWEEYNMLLKRFPNEFHILLEATRKEISSASSERIADAVIRVREGRIKFRPGYDGLYGQPIIFEDNAIQVEHKRQFDEEKKEKTKKSETEFNERPKPTDQRSLSDYL
jgi:uncharacterized protein (TIGR00375 family)